MKTKLKYVPPLVKVIVVKLDEDVALGYNVSVGTRYIDWEDGETLGDTPDDGGDIYLNF